MNNTRTPDPRRAQLRGGNSPDTIGPMLGLTQAESERGSIANFARAVVLNDSAGELPFFRELTSQTQAATGRFSVSPLTYQVPGEVLGRDMTKASAAGGGYLVGAGVEGFLTSLNHAMVLAKLPVTKLPHLTGDVHIGRETVKGSAGWLASESTQMPDGQAVYGAVSLSPKTVAASITVSRQLALQTEFGPQIERALAVTLAEKVDATLLAGSGAGGEPTGLANLSGVVASAGTGFTHAMSAAMLKASSGYEASGSVAWVCGVDAQEALQTRERAAGSGFIADNDAILNRPLYVSRSVGPQVLLCAPWSLVWWATWGALEVNVDPFTHFQSGRVIIRAMWTMDFACERAASVAIATALT